MSGWGEMTSTRNTCSRMEVTLSHKSKGKAEVHQCPSQLYRCPRQGGGKRSEPGDGIPCQVPRPQVSREGSRLLSFPLSCPASAARPSSHYQTYAWLPCFTPCNGTTWGQVRAQQIVSLAFLYPITNCVPTGTRKGAEGWLCVTRQLLRKAQCAGLCPHSQDRSEGQKVVTCSQS
jgi:hypothetical protein